MAFKIYTKTGDKGETALFGGRRVPKNHIQVDAYGTVDELNAFLGLLRDQISAGPEPDFLKTVQDQLFAIGAHLATEAGKKCAIGPLRADSIESLEAEIDRMEAQLPQLRHFILPGGHLPASTAHVCRTVCRRAERGIVALETEIPLDQLILPYLNRLSDYLFVLARFLMHQAGKAEQPWTPRQSE